MNKTYMLDTNICSFIMREQPGAVIKSLEQAVLRNHRIVVSVITYSEMRFGASGPKFSPATLSWLTRARLDAILAVDASTDVKVALRLAGMPIGPNDMLFQHAGVLRSEGRQWESITE